MPAAVARSNPRRTPCPDCGHTGSVEEYATPVPHRFCFACETWTPLESFAESSSNGPTAADHAADIESERQRQQAAAAEKAVELWNAAKPADHAHTYLVSKQIEPFGEIRQDRDDLLVPLYDLAGKLWNVQRITPTGDKFFLKESRKQNCFFVIGSLEAKILCFCEGYATGATIFAATELTVVVCFDAANLVRVATIFHAKYPKKQKIICADNDQFDANRNLRSPDKNVGLVKATQAAKIVNGLLAVPKFPPESHSTRPTDFNDMAQIISLSAVREKIHGCLLQPHQKQVQWLFSDFGNALILLEHLENELAYTPGLGWLNYRAEHGIWQLEPGAELARRKALETLRHVWSQRSTETQQQRQKLLQKMNNLDEADDNYESQRRTLTSQIKQLSGLITNIDKWITQCESAHRIRSTLEVSEGYLWTDPNVWDANPAILVCKNGVLDLATGQLHQHSPDFKATKSAGAAYDKAATHPAWTAMIQLLQAEGDRYDFVQQFCGSGLYGANPAEVVTIFEGVGGTGKSTLLTAVHSALGDYCTTIEITSLLQTDWRKQQKSAPREDLLKLRGARFVYPSIEPPKHAKLDDGSIKALSSNDVICARLPYAKQSVNFVPHFKLVIPTNYPLATSFDDSGMLRRLVVCPFNQKPTEPDPSIKAALMHDEAAKSAVLAWLYQGFASWQTNKYKFARSEYTQQATRNYWAELDPYSEFAKENLVFTKHAQTTKKDMGDAFKAWRDEAGRREASLRELSKWLTKKGVYEVQDPDPRKRTRIWEGVGLLNNTNITNNSFRETEHEESKNNHHATEFAGNNVRDVRNVQATSPANDQPPDFEREQQQG